MKRSATISVVAMIILAGCSGIPVIGGDQTKTASETSTDAQQSSTIGTNLGEIVLRLSDLNGEYNQTGGYTKTKNLTENGAIKKRVRTFLVEETNTDAASLIYSSAILFTDPDAASHYIEQTKSKFHNNGINTNTTQIAGNTVISAHFTNDRELKTIALYNRDSNLVTYLLISDSKDYYTSQAENLLFKMISDV